MSSSNPFTSTQWAIGIVALTVAFISLICSLTTLWLIKIMKLWNGYIFLITLLTISQVLYDISFFFIPAAMLSNKPTWKIIAAALSSFGGLSAGFFTNVMSLVIYYVVLKLKSFDIQKRYRAILFLVCLPSLLMAVFAVLLVSDPHRDAILQLSYFTVRCSCVVLNLYISILIKRKLNRMAKATDRNNGDYYDPLHALVGRIKYYPLCQSIYIIGAVWYYALEGFGESLNYMDTSESGLLYSLALGLYAVCNAITGIGYFAIFLAMQVLYSY